VECWPANIGLSWIIANYKIRYIPFVPIRCEEPEGPLDSPTFAKEETPSGFWHESAEQVFKAAREIIDLIEICQKKDKLPQSTIVLFAIWTAAFVALYAIHFPQMDVKQHILNHRWNEPPEGTKDDDIFHRGPLGLTYATLSKMSVCLNMASTYITVLQKMDNYFEKIRRDYYRHVHENKSLSEKTSLSVRLGGRGGGLEEYKSLSILKEFGPVQPYDPSNIDVTDQSRASTVDRGSPIIGEGHLPPMMDRGRTPRSTPSMSFTAINQTPSSNSQLHDTNGTGGSHEMHSAGWDRHHASRQMQSPAQVYASSAVAMLDPPSTAGQGSVSDSDGYDLSEEERKRFSYTNDLGILTQNNDPWMDGQQISFFDLTYDNYPIALSEFYT
jgi:hypothetical protein